MTNYEELWRCCVAFLKVVFSRDLRFSFFIFSHVGTLCVRLVNMERVND